MTFGWATDDPALRRISMDVLHQRFQGAGIATRYYNPEIHCSAFALPQYIRDAIGKKTGAAG